MIRDDQAAAVAELAAIVGTEATIDGATVRLIPSAFSDQGDLSEAGLFDAQTVSVGVPIATFSGIIHPGRSRATFAGKNWKAGSVTTHLAHLEVDFIAE